MSAPGLPSLHGLARAEAVSGEAIDRADASSKPAVGAERGEVVVVLLIELARGALLWGWSRVVWGDWLLRDVPGLRFAKALGSGHEAGFGLRPSVTRQGLFAVFETEADADRFLADSPTYLGYRSHARELLAAKLGPISSRGRWSGHAIAVPTQVDPAGPVAALTRASIRPSRAWSFWRRSPASEAAIAQAGGCRLAAGLGEAPLLRQATFSIWDNQASMDAYARSGPHLEAIRAAQREGYFSESMFVRFQVLQLRGSFKGRRYG